MSFKETWKPRVDGVDDADSSAVNEIAEAVINNEENIENIDEKTYSKQEANTLFANALKGSAIGEIVSLKDVSPLEHILGVKVGGENIADIEAVKVRAQGKNLANIYGFGTAISNNGVVKDLTNKYGTTISTTEPNNSIEVIQETAGDNSAEISYRNGYFYIGMNSNFQEGEAITISFDLNIKSNPLNAKTMRLFVNGVNMDNFNIENNKCYKSFNWVKSNYENSYFEIRIAGCSFVMSNIQLEVGETDTEYEPYKEPVEYTVNADGTVEGVKSIAPTTTLMTDTEGVLIEVEYNKDANKVVASLEQRLAALEAAIISQ